MAPGGAKNPMFVNASSVQQVWEPPAEPELVFVLHAHPAVRVEAKPAKRPCPPARGKWWQR